MIHFWDRAKSGLHGKGSSNTGKKPTKVLKWSEWNMRSTCDTIHSTTTADGDADMVLQGYSGTDMFWCHKLTLSSLEKEFKGLRRKTYFRGLSLG